ncbi:MAG: hypothetical protein JZD41_09155 [Thermoproteus sp.]|nr:hypothetical protein [Thermoproteus sp.]
MKIQDAYLIRPIKIQGSINVVGNTMYLFGGCATSELPIYHNFSIFTKIYSNDYARDQKIVSTYDGSSCGFSLGVVNNGIYIETWDVSRKFYVKDNILEPGWHSLGFTYDEDNEVVDIFIDGDHIGSFKSIICKNKRATLGALTPNCALNFTGIIDYIVYTPFILNEDEIAYLACSAGKIPKRTVLSVFPDAVVDGNLIFLNNKIIGGIETISLNTVFNKDKYYLFTTKNKPPIEGAKLWIHPHGVNVFIYNDDVDVSNARKIGKNIVAKIGDRTISFVNRII